eukprot:Skav225770  [mRNA]  locus=scaffold3092:149125:150405:+ [translate_table: standard]
MDWPSDNEVQVVVTAVGTMKCKCVIQPCNSLVTVHPPQGWMDFFVTGSRLLLKNFRTTWCEDEVQLYLDPLSKIFPCPSNKRGPMQVAELFAGLGGWSNAGRFLGMHTAIFVEKCEITAEACARTHKCKVMKPNDYIELVTKGEQPSMVVLHADVTDDDTWMALTMTNVAYVLGSPPCQPWSGSGRTKGLSAPEGQVFSHILTRGAKLAILVMVMENVPNITKHSDYKTLVKNATMQGMRLLVADNHEIAKMSPVRRDRWLGTFVHSSVLVHDDDVIRAKNITLANESFQVGHVSPSLGQVHGVHVNMTELERKALMVDDEVLDILGKSEYAPWWITNQCKSTNPKDILQARIVREDKQIFAIMASYGGQHKLPSDLLCSKGLQTVLTADSQGVRYFSPWEFAKALGYDNSTWIPTQVHLAWRMTE